MKLLQIFISTALCLSTAISAEAYDINVNVTSKQYQHITGFGAAAMGDLMCPIQDSTIIAKLYGASSPVGLNIMRIEISPNLVSTNSLLKPLKHISGTLFLDIII